MAVREVKPEVPTVQDVTQGSLLARARRFRCMLSRAFLCSMHTNRVLVKTRQFVVSFSCEQRESGEQEGLKSHPVSPGLLLYQII